LTFSRQISTKLYKRESNPKIKERLLLVLKAEGDGMLPAHAADELHRSRYITNFQNVICFWIKIHNITNHKKSDIILKSIKML
jgi:hypothetical protein